MSSRLIGPFPVHGPWTAVGLTRGWFLAILGLSVLGFVVIGGPVWRHPREGHFLRIVASYTMILPLVGLALRNERPFPLGRFVAASALIGLVKLVVTALLLGGIALATR